METDSPFCYPEACPGEEGQAQVDRCGIQGVHRIFELHGQRFFVVELTHDADQVMSKIAKDASIPYLVRFRQDAAGNLAADAHVIKFVALHPEADLNVPQAFPIRQLGKSHDAELIHAGKALHAELATVSLHAMPKGFQWHEVHDLGKHKRKRVYACSFPDMISGKIYRLHYAFSSR